MLFRSGNFDLSRDLQIAFQPSTIKFNDGYAHTDYGPWSGETRLVESYKPFNVMEQAYRTVQVAKGLYPYVLVIDDAKKDDQLHQFDWNISVPVDADLVDVSTPEVVFQNTEPSPNRVDDIVLGKASTPKDPQTGKYKFKKGDPLCLIRVLWRNTEYGFSVPKFEKLQGYSLVTVPARAVSPEFRILIYPYKFGEPVPQTIWNKDRTELQVQIKEQKDTYHFAQTEGGRTVFSMKRNGRNTLQSNAKPAKPVLIVRGERFNQSDFRYTRDADKAPSYLINDSVEVEFVRPVAPALIRYTLDGSEPGMHSSVYTKTFVLNKTSVLKAKVFDADWQAGENNSEVLTANLIVKNAIQGLSDAPVNSKNGLVAKVFEISTKIYNDKGFFDASKIMMPDVAKVKPLHVSVVNHFMLPWVTPKQPQEEQCKGFYQFNGWFYAKQKAVYTFDVNSCGPVTLDIAKQAVIQATGLFHQQQVGAHIVLGEVMTGARVVIVAVDALDEDWLAVVQQLAIPNFIAAEAGLALVVGDLLAGGIFQGHVIGI